MLSFPLKGVTLQDLKNAQLDCCQELQAEFAVSAFQKASGETQPR